MGEPSIDHPQREFFLNMKNIKDFPGLAPESRKPFLVFLFLYLVFCLATFHRYGVTWDEFDGAMNGGQWIKYYLGKPNTLFSAKPDLAAIFATHSYYNSAVVRMLTFSKTILPDRTHLVNLILALPVFWCFFELLMACFKDWRWALAGPFLLVLTPRFFGDIPANPRDTPFAVLYFACLTYMVMRKEWTKIWWMRSVILGVLCGLAIGIRIVGFTLFPLYVLFRFYEEFSVAKKRDLANFGIWLLKEAFSFSIILVVSQLLLCLLWPFLGQDYFHHIWYTFGKTVSLGFDKTILFMGRPLNPLHQFLWYYLPVWILVTTPLFILLFAIFSMARFQKHAGNRVYFLMVLTLGFNLVFYVLLKPEILNGLRYYLFLLPVISFLAYFGMVDLFQSVTWRPGRWLTGSFIALSVLMVTVEWIRLFPYEYIYFNELTGGLKGAQGKYELDYWGASLREATEWLRDNECGDAKRTYKVRFACDQWQQGPFCSPNMVGYTEFTEKEADYWMILNEMNNEKIPASGEVIHAVEREGVPLAFVVKMEKPDPKE